MKIIAIRCINCGKETGLYMDNMNTNYKNITTSFVFNTLLHHICISKIIETLEQLKSDIYNHNQDSIIGGPWYNTSLCKKKEKQCLKNLLQKQELIDIISCFLLIHMRNNSHNLLMKVTDVVVMRYNQIQQQNHSFYSLQPLISLIVG